MELYPYSRGVLLALGILFSSLVLPAVSAPFRPEDTFSPICGTLLPDPPPGGWKPWSDPATWQGAPVPGIGGGVGANVTIPCGVGVLLDLPLVQLTVLNISGSLKFRDDPSLPFINLTTSFAVVGGRFIIGSTQQQFRQRAEIRLAPNPRGRANLAISYPQPADPVNRRNIGHKAFAVVGGQVDFHGLPGGASTPSWVRLAATAQVGDMSITVKGDVSGWPTGAPIVISSTDYSYEMDDVRSITGVICTVDNTCQIVLNRGLNFSHFGDALGVPDGFGGYIDETAEVALLSRNIVVTGTDERAPFNLEGGHFIIFFTATPQILEGVQFLMMGQQGVLGRYNIHFHVCGDDGKRSVVRKNLMIHSKQRCVVVHATDNTVIDGNVAYNTSGHCFMVEEGGETGNLFIRNLGMRTRAVTVSIPISAGSNETEETDSTPSTFWITNPNNSYVDNVAGGADDSGFWLELRDRVRGLSAIMRRLNQTIPRSTTPLGFMTGNSAHSNNIGFRGYKKGYSPRFNSTVDKPWGPPVWTNITGMSFWKNREKGAFLHGMSHVALTNCTFADNPYGAHMSAVTGVNVTNSRFVGLSRNFGNPSNCQSLNMGRRTCGSISGCMFPLPAGTRGRSVTSRGMNRTIFGLVFDENRFMDMGKMSNFASGNTFSSYESTSCRVAAAVGVGGNKQVYWNAGFGFASLKFDSASPTNPVYLLPPTWTEVGGNVVVSGQVANFFAIRDFDGSIMGTPGYIVANNSALLPPASYSPPCRPLAGSNGFACPGACYRTVFIAYQEDNVGMNLTGSSALRVTRLEDGASQVLLGNQMVDPKDDEDEFDNVTNRYFSLVLLGGYTYEVSLVPSSIFPSFVPLFMKVTYRDGPGCGLGVTLRFRGSTQGPYSWTLDQSDDDISWVPCPGNSAALSGSSAPIQFSYPCVPSSGSQELVLDVTLTPSFPSGTVLDVTRVNTASPQCTPTTGSLQCGLVAASSAWVYNQQGANLQPAYPGGPAFYNPLYPPATSAPLLRTSVIGASTSSGGDGVSEEWRAGRGVLGSQSRARTLLADPSRNRTTYYFRTTFNVSSSACYSGIRFDILLRDGVVLYLNNIEILRANLPDGPLSNATKALSILTAYNGSNYVYTTFNVSTNGASSSAKLVEGANHLAAQVFGAGDVFFAVKAVATRQVACSGAATSAETCDGLDNDNDGRVDVNPSTNQLLQRPCSTACGTGLETCTNGAFQGCTAPPVLPEVCNGIDDNCDGMVDNGIGQLDCANGTVCFAGKCQPLAPLTVSQSLLNAESSGWLYSDRGFNLDAFQAWKTGTPPAAANFTSGTGAFGVYPSNTSLTFSTPLAPNTRNNITTRYFLRSFTLSPDDRALTYGFLSRVRACDGAIVFLNGAEIFRTNMPPGSVSFATLATTSAARTSSSNPNALTYYPSPILRSSGSSAVSGQNWVAAELHSSSLSQKNWVFDMTLTRFAALACPGSNPCVRNPPADTLIVPLRDTWQFIDATRPLPPSTWFSPSFGSSSWTSGKAPFGHTAGTVVSLTDRFAFYYRKTVSIPDGRCFFNLTLTVQGLDGFVVYLNGLEALRMNMPSGFVNGTTTASTWGSSSPQTFSLSGGWLTGGVNVIAAEVHPYARRNGTYFDLSLVGQREGVTCSPLPL